MAQLREDLGRVQSSSERMEERLAVVLARRMGLDLRRDSAPVLLAYLTRAVSDTAFNVWYDQRREDVAGLVDELVSTLRSVAAPPRRGGGRRRGPPPGRAVNPH